MKRISILILFVFAIHSSKAQAPVNWNSADMFLAIKKLKVLGSVLYIAAHPDDENTRLLAYMSKDKLYRTGYLALTRGDGGQNLIGNEQGVELGLIRTQELLAARRIDGAEQFFSRAFDFGFSKNPEETFTKWDKEKILSDVVWIIRKFQPDIIITRFPTTGEGGHGHHTASAILANEAFTTAADPNRFPEQLSAGSGGKYVQPWKAKRILWNTFNFGSTNTTSEQQFKTDVGGYNPLLGKSYGEIAAASRSQHKSQGFGVPAQRGEAIEYFKTTGGDAPVNDLMDGVEQTWKRVKGGEQIENMIDSISNSFDLMHPEKSVKSLVNLYKAISQLQDGYWKTQKLYEVQQLIEQCSGLFIDATTNEQFAVQTDSVRINLSLNNRLGANATLKEYHVGLTDSTINISLAKNKNYSFSKTQYVPADKPLTQPYWLKDKMEEGYFNVADQTKIGQPDVDASYIAKVIVEIEGYPFTFTRNVKYKFTDPVKGELYQPLFIIPVATVSSEPNNLLFKKSIKEEKLAVVKVNADKNIVTPVTTTIRSSNEFKKQIDSTGIAKFSSKEFLFTLLNDNKTPEKDQVFSSAEFTSGKDTLNAYLSIRAINYDHIPAIKYFYPDIIRQLNLDLKISGKKIGYIVGAGDKVPEALEQMGYEVTLLTDKELAKNNLQQFDAIITGVRAYNTNEWMNAYYDKLMKYVNDGGNLIVQYNTSSQIGPVRAKISPYNFDISRTRVTDENAEVTFLKPDHRVLNFPNKITDADFKGWVQERSIYHATNFDRTKFETIFSMHDPGESADDGSLIIAKYGKGYFTYTGLVFFRELPAGVPGSYRLLANIIALNAKKAF